MYSVKSQLTCCPIQQGSPACTSTKFAVEGFSEDMAIDLKPFGIRVTIVGPGFFHTHSLEGGSVKYGEVAVEDYAEAVAKQRNKYDAHGGKQLGDLKKLGQALLRIVAEDEPRFVTRPRATRCG